MHPIRRGRVRVLYYDSQTAPTPVREEIRNLVPGEPYEIDVPPPGIWVEIVNDDTEWDKDEPGGKP